MSNYCKGCMTLNYDNASCNRDSRAGRCPCTGCIIKVMCTNECREYLCFIGYDESKVDIYLPKLREETYE